MKRKKMVAVMLATVMLTSGCGGSNTTGAEAQVKESLASNVLGSMESTERTESAEGTGASTGKTGFVDAGDIDSLITERDESELDLKEYFYSFEDREAEKEGDAVFYLANFEMTGDYFYMTDSVDIYAYNGVHIGYTKPDISISMIGKCDNWYYFDLRGNTRFARVSDVEEAGFAGSEQDYIASMKPKEETPSTQASASGGGTSAPVAVQSGTPASSVEETAPADSGKYTPEEAVAVYRSLMEEGGMTWDPSLKDGGSWGTGWIYLEKGDAEAAAASDLESCAMGDSVGNAWTHYYIEVTGSDENAVYTTMWAD